MSRRWPGGAKSNVPPATYLPFMQTVYRQGVTIRQLRNGDTATVADLFARLGEQSRVRRFCGAKPRLSELELAQLARVDGDRHILVGYVDGDPLPVGIARLVRDGATAEIAVTVADCHQGRGIGTTLLHALAADARAAGITHFVATVCGDNPSILALLRKLSGPLEQTWRGGEREVVVGLGA
jgi:GNAT superfamily N-acetyltransferase